VQVSEPDRSAGNGVGRSVVERRRSRSGTKRSYSFVAGAGAKKGAGNGNDKLSLRFPAPFCHPGSFPGGATMRSEEAPMLTVKARYDGRVFIPEQPVDLPAETDVEIAIMPRPATRPANETPLSDLADIAHQFPENPALPT